MEEFDIDTRLAYTLPGIAFGFQFDVGGFKSKIRGQGSGPRDVAFAILSSMDAVTLTRQLIDSESISGIEAAVGNYLYGELCRLGYQTRKIAVEGDRFNVFATWPDHPNPTVVFSTHMDTVPPFIPSSEDEQKIYGRGSCDAKGIIAAQVAAAERLRQQEIYVGLLFVVGEERDSLGAKVANDHAPSRCRFLVNGEPTENRVALASKGTLRVEVVARGKMAHSAYPELGESAIDKLIAALARLRGMPLPADPQFGPCTLNIGLIEGGRAPNVIPDYAHADLLYRLIGPTDALRKEIVATAGDQVEVSFPLELSFLRLRTVAELPTMIAAFTTDIPKLTKWGEPLLIGPGSIHVAHTEGEFIEKQQLREAIDLYSKIGIELQNRKP
jgi:acetylornithine deacetylase